MNRTGITGAHNFRRIARLEADNKAGDRAGVFARVMHQSYESNFRNRAVRWVLENRKG